MSIGKYILGAGPAHQKIIVNILNPGYTLIIDTNNSQDMGQSISVRIISDGIAGNINTVQISGNDFFGGIQTDIFSGRFNNFHRHVLFKMMSKFVFVDAEQSRQPIKRLFFIFNLLRYNRYRRRQSVADNQFTVAVKYLTSLGTDRYVSCP